MTHQSVEDVKFVIVACLERSILPLGLAPADISDDFDMRAEGVIDSLGFVHLLTELEEQLGIDIDLADLDPAQLTVIGPLSRHIAALASAERKRARG